MAFNPPSQTINSTKPAKFAICTAVKDENRNMREWIHYHHWIGTNKFYIFDHNSTQPLMYDIQDWITTGIVDYIRFAGYNSHDKTTKRQFKLTGQGYAYQACLAAAKQNGHEWAAFLDPDEFIVLYQGDHQNISNFLEKYKEYGALVVNWRVFGSSGHRTRPKLPALLAYTKCQNDSRALNKQYKSIVHLPYTTGLRGNPHQFKYEEGRVAVNEDRQEVSSFFSHDPQYKEIGLHHYITRSYQEFQVKMVRGGGAGKRRTMNYWRYVNRFSQGTCMQGVESSRGWMDSMGMLEVWQKSQQEAQVKVKEGAEQQEGGGDSEEAEEDKDIPGYGEGYEREAASDGSASGDPNEDKDGGPPASEE